MRIINNQDFKELNYSYNLANRRFAGEKIGEFEPKSRQTHIDEKPIIDFSAWKDEGGGAGSGYKQDRPSVFDRAINDYPYGMRSQQQLDNFGFNNINNENMINFNANAGLFENKEEDDKDKEDDIFSSSSIHINDEPRDDDEEPLYKTTIKKTKFDFKKKKKKGKRGGKFYNPRTGDYQNEPLTEEDYSSVDASYKGPMPGVKGPKHNQTGNWTEEIDEEPQESFLERLARYGRYAGYINSASKLGYLAYNTYRVIRNRP